MTSQLPPLSEIYALPDWADDPKGICLPDVVIASLLSAMIPVTKGVFEKHVELDKKGEVPQINRHRILIPVPQLPWDQSGRLLVMGLEALVPMMGERARGVVAAKKRWKCVPVEPGDCWGRCQYPEDPAKEKAMIEFGCDGTISDAVYAAFEMGHLLAGDMSQERKLLGRDYYPRRHMNELQGFFLQHAFYAWLMHDPRAAFLKDEARRHYIGDVTRSMYNSVLSAAALEAFKQGSAGVSEKEIKKGCVKSLQKMLGPGWEYFENAAWLAANGADYAFNLQNMVWSVHAHSGAAIIGAGLYDRYSNAKDEQRLQILEALYCTGSRNAILDVLDAAGVNDQATLDAFMQESVWAAAEPLQKLYADTRMAARKTGA